VYLFGGYYKSFLSGKPSHSSLFAYLPISSSPAAQIERGQKVFSKMCDSYPLEASNVSLSRVKKALTNLKIFAFGFIEAVSTRLPGGKEKNHVT
jgi:hypothetical protein